MSYSNTADWTLCHGTTSGPGRNRNVLLSASWPKEASIFRICLKGTLLSLPLLSAAMLTFQSLSLVWSSFSHTTCLLDIDFPSAEILSSWVGAELSCLFYPGDREEPLRQSEFPELLLCCLLLTGVQGGQSHLLDWIQFFPPQSQHVMLMLYFKHLMLPHFLCLTLVWCQPAAPVQNNYQQSLHHGVTALRMLSASPQPPVLPLFLQSWCRGMAMPLEQAPATEKAYPIASAEDTEKGMCRHSSQPDRAGPKHWFSEEKHSVLISLTTFIL